ncbi:MAG TPA: polynucleotide adenylyltransferase PcnB [Myxococcaceae bacterium]|nr:polynucleotide adenylyltransferase PcnB [Myxococcaceae bacterium]
MEYPSRVIAERTAAHSPASQAAGEQLSPASPEIAPSLLDPDALKVVGRLRQHGHEAYLVGGCVRDLLLGQKPKDFDLATSAHPGEVRAIFRNSRLIGRRFRLAHIYFKGGKVIEVSTFRANPIEVEEAPLPARRAEEDDAEDGDSDATARAEADLLITEDNVFGTAEQDARRRDFTINGLFYDVAAGRVIDYVRGRRDLQEQWIRTIGDPEIRIREDPVRILRAVRFACRLHFEIEPCTYAAMEGAVEDLPRCAPPRVLEETFRLLRGGIAQPSLKLLRALGALKLLMPAVDDFLETHGKDGEVLFDAFAAAADRRILAGEHLDDAVLLGALLLPISRATSEPAADAASGAHLAQAIEQLLTEFVRSARLPRRIAERTRAILLAQAVLSGERRRRGSLARFRRHPIFNEALTLFGISVEATGQHQQTLEVWKSGELPAFETAAADRPKRRRRRRRGGGPARTHS